MNTEFGGGSSSLSDNLQRLEGQIEAACRGSGRRRSEILLVAVSKGQPAAAVAEALSLGVLSFGESRVQEFDKKRAQLAPALQEETAARRAPEFRLIGHLQSNKAAHAINLFDSVDTVDSLRIAERLNGAAASQGRRLSVLLEIKLSEEPSKTGLVPDSNELNALLERLPSLASLDLRGMMLVPPYFEDVEAARPYFVRLRKLRDRLSAAHPRLNLSELSAGMSHDFTVAIAEGATQIRIGSALFGARPAV